MNESQLPRDACKHCPEPCTVISQDCHACGRHIPPKQAEAALAQPAMDLEAKAGPVCLPQAPEFVYSLDDKAALDVFQWGAKCYRTALHSPPDSKELVLPAAQETLSEVTDYKKLYEDAMAASNEAGFVGLDAAATIRAMAELLSANTPQPPFPADWFPGMPEAYRTEAWRIKTSVGQEWVEPKPPESIAQHKYAPCERDQDACPMQPILLDSDGVVRFKRNKIVQDLYELHPMHGLDLNEMAIRAYSQEDRNQFAQLIGYSVSGWGDLGCAMDVDKADGIAMRLTQPTTQAQEPAEGYEFVDLQDGRWYWVQYEGLDRTYQAPAMFKEDAKAFYSHEFSGIPVSQAAVIRSIEFTAPQASQEPPDERDRFERAARKEGCVDFTRVGDAYTNRRTLRCYRIWQARGALAAQPQSPLAGLAIEHSEGN